MCNMFKLCEDYVLRFVFMVGENIVEVECMVMYMVMFVLNGYIKLFDSILEYVGVWFVYFSDVIVLKLEYSKLVKLDRVDIIFIFLFVINWFSKDFYFLLLFWIFEDCVVCYWCIIFIFLY